MAISIETLALCKKLIKTYVDSAISKIPSGINYKGAVNYQKDLPTNPALKDAYTVLYQGESGNVTDGREFVWSVYNDKTQWIPLGETLFRLVTIPTAAVESEGQIIQYIGQTTADYVSGYFYVCVKNNNVYTWEECDVQRSPILNEENTFTGKNNFNAATIFNETVTHTKDVSISDAIVKLLDTTANLVTQYAADEIVRDIGNQTYNIKLPSKSGTLSLESDNGNRIYFGKVIPTSGDYRLGDVFINTDSKIIYQIVENTEGTYAWKKQDAYEPHWQTALPNDTSTIIATEVTVVSCPTYQYFQNTKILVNGYANDGFDSGTVIGTSNSNPTVFIGKIKTKEIYGVVITPNSAITKIEDTSTTDDLATFSYKYLY